MLCVLFMLLVIPRITDIITASSTAKMLIDTKSSIRVNP